MKKSTKKNLLLISIVAVVLLIMLSINKPSHDTITTNMPTAYQSLGFTLDSDKGKVSLTDFTGKWVFLYVGYTFCPDICPTNLGSLSQAYQLLTEEEKAQINIEDNNGDL